MKPKLKFTFCKKNSVLSGWPIAAVQSLFFIILIAIMVFPCLTAQGASDDRSFTNWPAQLSLGGNLESISYAEYVVENDALKQIMELGGNLPGFTLGARLPFSNDVVGWNYLFGQLDGGFSSGQLLYNGSTWGGDPIVDRPSDDQIYSLSGSIGGTYDAGDTVLESYAGASFRHWYNEIEGGYRRRITQYYWKGGVSLRFILSSIFAVGVGAEGQNLISGEVTSYLSDVDTDNNSIDTDSGFNDPTVTQDEGYGFRGFLNTWIDFLGTAIKAEGYVSYLDIADSDTAILTINGSPYGSDYEVYEPRNKTISYGVTLSLAWGS